MSRAMRWFRRSLVALALLWAVYLLSPYVALYNLAKALEARDVALIVERVDFPALRLSLARQIAAAYTKAVAPPKDGKSPTSGLGSGAGAAFIEPLLEPYVSPQAIVELMRGGWRGLLRQDAAPVEKSAGAELLEAGSFLTTANLRRLWSLTEWRGFRVFLVRLPQDGTDEPLQLQFRLGRPDLAAVGSGAAAGAEGPPRARSRRTAERREVVESMIPKSGCRFSEKIMLKQRGRAG